MIEINSARFKSKPFAHQLEGIKKLVENKAFALFDEMGCGKSAQVINAACVLAEAGEIDTVLIVAPASVRCVWLDKEIGEIKKHSWHPLNVVAEYHAKNLKSAWSDTSKDMRGMLLWVVTNYEFLRNNQHLETLCSYLEGNKVLLVCDESSYVKNRSAAQTKATMKLRSTCARCVILNGTPIANSPMDLWSQMQVLSPKILACYKNFYNFRYEYCEMRSQNFGGQRFQQIVSYKNLDHLAKKLAPYVLRREKKDCLDLPPKLYTEREVPLSLESWKRYKELKRDFIMTLGENDVRLEPNAAVRIMRLAQLTSGITAAMFITDEGEDKSDELLARTNYKDLSDEKLKWAVKYLTEECTARAVIVWTRWRRERERLVAELWKHKDTLTPYELYGGQRQADRETAVQYFTQPLANRECRMVLVAQPHAGGHGLNLVAASEAIYLSNDFALGIRLQSEDRCHRPGQVNPVTYIDVLATGPKGERTVDHVIFKALREKQNIAAMTTHEWRKGLSDD